MKLMMIFLVSMLLTMAATYAFAEESIKQCLQADGTVLYTNKNIKGCKSIKVPELSVVPSLHNMPHYIFPHTDFPTPPSILLPAQIKSLPDGVCSLYSEWVHMNEKQQGGLRNNTVETQQRRVMLTMVFGSGFYPYGCQ